MSKPLFLLIKKNKRKTNFLIFWFIFLVTALGALIGFVIKLFTEGSWWDMATAAFLAMGISLIYAFVQFFYSRSLFFKPDSSVLVTEKSDPVLYHVVEDMAFVAGVPMPEIYIIDDSSLNAFATGRNPESAILGITKGLREKLNREELEGVVGHEVGHIKNYDIRLSSMAVALSVAFVGLGVFSFRLASVFFDSDSRRNSKDSYGAVFGLIFIAIGAIFLIIGVPLSKILTLALGREREFLADATSVELTGNPKGLSRALGKIELDENVSSVLAKSPAAALCIGEPKRKKSFFGSWRKLLFSSHPETESRVERLGVDYEEIKEEIYVKNEQNSPKLTNDVNVNSSDDVLSDFQRLLDDENNSSFDIFFD